MKASPEVRLPFAEFTFNGTPVSLASNGRPNLARALADRPGRDGRGRRQVEHDQAETTLTVAVPVQETIRTLPHFRHPPSSPLEQQCRRTGAFVAWCAQQAASCSPSPAVSGSVPRDQGRSGVPEPRLVVLHHKRSGTRRPARSASPPCWSDVRVRRRGDLLRVPARARARAVHQRVRARAAQARADQPGRPDGGDPQRGVRAVGRLLPHARALYVSHWIGAEHRLDSRVRGEHERERPELGAGDYTSSLFIAGLVVSFMVMPMACAVMREVFSLCPAGEKEAALALGSTRWGMIRAVLLPFGKAGSSAARCSGSAGHWARRSRR